MISHDLSCLLGGKVPPDSLDKISFRIHEIEIYAVIYQIILTWLYIWWCREIYPIFLAHRFSVLVRPSQAYYVWMELFKILLDDCWRVPSRVTSDENRAQNVSAALLDKVDHDGHFVQFFRTYVRTVREAKIHQSIFAVHIFVGKPVPVLIYQIKGPSHFRFSNTLC